MHKLVFSGDGKTLFSMSRCYEIHAGHNPGNTEPPIPMIRGARSFAGTWLPAVL